MKKTILFFSVFILASVANVLCAQDGQTNYTMDLTVGTVEVSHDGGSKWAAAEVDSVLKESDMVRTGKGAYCEIGLPDDKGSFRVQELSQVKLSKLGKETRVKVVAGKSIFDFFKPLFRDESFEVESQTAIAAVRGTQFFVESMDGTGVISVEDGVVNVRRNVDIDLDKDLRQEFAEAVETKAQAGQEVEFGKKDNEEFAAEVKKLRSNKAELRKYLASQREQMKKRVRQMRDRQRIAAQFRDHRADIDKIKQRKQQILKNRSQMQNKKADLRNQKKSNVKKALMNRKKLLRNIRER